jgi:predicted permease
MHTLFGNIVFIGFPFLNSLFPDGHGILYAATFQLASDSVLWTIGIICIRNDGQKDKADSFRHLFNVNTISFFAALICIIIGFRIPETIEKPFSMLGHTTMVLSLVFVGHLLSTVEFNSTVKKKSLYMLSFNKLLLVPILILFIIFIVKSNFPFIEKAAIASIILQCGMPAMATVAILAKKYNSDYQTASENIFVSTILSILTLPFLWLLINMFFK